MRRILIVGRAAVFALSGGTVLAQDYQPALTEYGQPDLSGV